MCIRDSCEGINYQTERMLNEYGNAVLRLAYSYLHNTADAEEDVYKRQVLYDIFCRKAMKQADVDEAPGTAGPAAGGEAPAAQGAVSYTHLWRRAFLPA